MSFLKERTIEDSINLLVELSGEISKLGGDLSCKLYNLAKSHSFLELIDYKFDYSMDYTKSDFLYARQIQALFNKQDFIDLGIDTEAVAWSKFLESEERCRETNIRLDSNFQGNPDVAGVLYSMQRKIVKILGECPSIDSLDLSFGPGANTSTKSLIASPRVKLNSRLECSANLLPVVRELLSELPALCGYHCTVESENSFTVPITITTGKLAFVPKTSKTLRSIVVEPSLNGLGQKGIGKILKGRLRRVGVDLTDQTRNQSLALKGSLDSSLATIDLSSASDCISRALVWSLLPYDWACLLDMFRTPEVRYKNQTYYLEKFSSMGNAFTFELESLLFYAMAICTCEHLGLETKDVSVYGDDIIVPVESFSLLEELLQYLGFSLNRDKSFATGSFRESCGADYLDGLDIRPFYVRSIINDQLLYSMHNFFMRSFEFNLAALVHDLTHAPSRLYGPDGYGDGHLIGSYTPRSSRKMKRDGFEGGVFDTYRLNPKTFKKRLKSDYVYPCYSIYVRGEGVLGSAEANLKPSEPSDPYVVRGSRGYAKISIYTLAHGIFSRVSVHKHHGQLDPRAE